ncbi:uncharacterized protein SCHCODRAFT_02619756 [Schizophyllum commune H4-8]|uniref:uncharacterized protein n=1 Tax=Schizophyllum commune (strain H4-8 / FGSC 9210) TaxID=578458 RepID=UPI00215F0803|nr:uncharacterized protein SCHCODRAFT_02619756 [Schizophyllum commune H4-8]KAI5895557.1 hypothetical protein SCHCODRAFT_02619756 [Schizophyllum commune H4-8]
MDASSPAIAGAVLNDWDLAREAPPLFASCTDTPRPSSPAAGPSLLSSATGTGLPSIANSTRLPSHVVGSFPSHVAYSLPSHVAYSLPSPPSTTFAAIDVLHDAFTGGVERMHRHEVERLHRHEVECLHRHEVERLHRHGVERLYRHDLEAFIWILIWVACCVEGGKPLEPLPESLEGLVLGDASLVSGGASWVSGDASWVSGGASLGSGDAKQYQFAKLYSLRFGHNAVKPTRRGQQKAGSRMPCGFLCGRYRPEGQK